MSTKKYAGPPRTRMNNEYRAAFLRWADRVFAAPAAEADVQARFVTLRGMVEEQIGAFMQPGDLDVLKRHGMLRAVDAVRFMAPGESGSDSAFLFPILPSARAKTVWRVDATKQHNIIGVSDVRLRQREGGDGVSPLAGPSTHAVFGPYPDRRTAYLPKLRGTPEVAGFVYAVDVWLSELKQQRQDFAAGLARTFWTVDVAELRPDAPANLLNPSATALVSHTVTPALVASIRAIPTVQAAQ